MSPGPSPDRASYCKYSVNLFRALLPDDLLRIRFRLSPIVFLAALWLPLEASADCSGSGLAPNDPNGQGCVYVSPSQSVPNMPPSLAAPDGSSYSHYACTITNSKCGEQIMAPFYSAAEWESFYNNTTCATFTNCKVNPCTNLGAGQAFLVDAVGACKALTGNVNGCAGGYTTEGYDFWGVKHITGPTYPQPYDLSLAAKICQQQAAGVLTAADGSLPCHPDAIYPLGFVYTGQRGCTGCSWSYWSNANWVTGTGPTQYSANASYGGSSNTNALVSAICGTKNLSGTQPAFCSPATVSFNGTNYNLPYGVPLGLGSNTAFCINDVTQSSYAAAFPGEGSGNNHAAYTACGATAPDRGPGGYAYVGLLSSTNSHEFNNGVSDALYSCAGSGWTLAGAALCDATHYNCSYGNSVNNGTLTAPAITRLVYGGYSYCYYLAGSQSPCTDTYPADAGYCMWISSAPGSFACPAWDGPKYSWQCQNPANGASVPCTASD